MSNWRCLKKSKTSFARRGRLTTRHGVIQTPFFMPIATVGAVKTISFEDLLLLRAQIVLSNTYHLMLRPGANMLEKFGGLHEFMRWDKPILTDSGGYQVFSLSKIRRVQDSGVEFQSHLDGRRWSLTPEKTMQIQFQLGSDIMMPLDECIATPASRTAATAAVKRTSLWAARQIKSTFARRARRRGQLLFGIVQGALYPDLRRQSARDLVKLNFDGYAIGGLAVGEKPAAMYRAIENTIPELPTDQARYLMGVGRPEQIVEAVKRGIDMFDCVIPSREARHGRLYLWRQPATIPDLSRRDFYHTINITNQKFTTDHTPINSASKFPELRQYSRAYLRHLFATKEPLALRLATLNNIEFYLDLMTAIRRQIAAGTL